jgi:hypothetical protein
MEDLVQEEYEVTEPRADALIHSLRAFGYDLSTALADLIDNSISAGAQNVWLEFFWNGGQSTIALMDDGQGMSETELQNAMRPGSRSPLEERAPRDLGRFGLGLKTASFSQAKSMTVGTKQEGKVSVRRWDLDYVSTAKEWRLLKQGSATFQDKAFSFLDRVPTGTVVFWEKLDRLVAPTAQSADGKAQQQFYQKIDRLVAHLAMVFHRYLKPDPGQKGLRIWIQDREVKAWDPFLSNEPATRVLSEESLRLFGNSMNVRAYVLPHASKLRTEVHQRAAGPLGWNAQQGFYIYRNRRLVVAGSWLRLKDLREEEHYKLARILVDIPNHLDDQWEIDVKKSRAYPPAAIREQLTAMATKTRAEASRVYRQRGARLQSVTERRVISLWEAISKNNRIRFHLNREHPVVQAALAAAREPVEELLRFVEETVPASSGHPQDGDEGTIPAAPFEGQEQTELLSTLRKLYERFVDAGIPPEEARRTLATMDPFHRFPTLIGMLEEKEL